MLLLVLGGLQEDFCDLLVAFLLGDGCEIGVLIASLAFAGKSLIRFFSVLVPFSSIIQSPSI
jgi:hypothetical protein